MSVLVFQCMLVKNTVKTDSLETHSCKVVFTNKCVSPKFYNLSWFLIAQEMFTDKKKETSWGVGRKPTGERNAFIPVAT